MLWNSTSALRGVAGIAFNVATLSQRRWNANASWTHSIGNTDVLQLYDKRTVVESTLRAMGLDHTRLPVTYDPDYRHTAPADEAAAARAHAERMCALTSGQAPPSFTSTSFRYSRSNRPSLQVCRCSKQLPVTPPDRTLPRMTSQSC